VLLASLVAAGDVSRRARDVQQQHRDAETEGRADRFRPVQPVVARPQGIGVAKNAPHPQRRPAVLEYVLSPEGAEAVSNRWAGPLRR
jgi:iron(III) transport system substrate-binding protein